MLKACGRCGKLHPIGYRCTKGRTYNKGNEEKIRSSFLWKQKREEIRSKAHYMCEVCKDKGIYHIEDIEVHHINKLTQAEDEAFDNSNLIVLCRFHHKQADAGELDKDYLRSLAKIREEIYTRPV